MPKNGSVSALRKFVRAQGDAVLVLSRGTRVVLNVRSLVSICRVADMDGLIVFISPTFIRPARVRPAHSKYCYNLVGSGISVGLSTSVQIRVKTARHQS